MTPTRNSSTNISIYPQASTTFYSAPLQLPPLYMANPSLYSRAPLQGSVEGLEAPPPLHLYPTLVEGAGG
jgi:hypothetical protein